MPDYKIGFNPTTLWPWINWMAPVLFLLGIFVLCLCVVIIEIQFQIVCLPKVNKSVKTWWGLYLWTPAMPTFLLWLDTLGDFSLQMNSSKHVSIQSEPISIWSNKSEICQNTQQFTIGTMHTQHNTQCKRQPWNLKPAPHIVLTDVRIGVIQPDGVKQSIQ